MRPVCSERLDSAPSDATAGTGADPSCRAATGRQSRVRVLWPLSTLGTHCAFGTSGALCTLYSVHALHYAHIQSAQYTGSALRCSGGREDGPELHGR